MEELRKFVTVLALSSVLLAFAAPALAQMQGGTMMPAEQSGKDMMTALRDTKDTGMAASIMKTAGLEGMTMPGGKYTLFVASDEALKATSPDIRNMMMEKLKDRQAATEFVKGHMVSDVVMPDDMSDGRTLALMNGKTMTVRMMDGRMMVDDATITKAVETSNGMIYVMDRIPSSIMTMLEEMGVSPMSAMPVSR